MHHADIQAAIVKSGHSQTKLAAELGVTPQTVNFVVCGKRVSYRVASHIARRIGRDIHELWPGRYDRRAA